MSSDMRVIVAARMAYLHACGPVDKEAGWRDWARGGLRLMGNVGGSIGGGIAGTAASAATGGTMAIPMAIGGGAAGGLAGDAIASRVGNWLFGPEEPEQPQQPQPQTPAAPPTQAMPTTASAPKTAGARTMTNLDRMAAAAAFDRLGIVLPAGMDKEAWINMALQGARLANTGVGRGVGKALQWGGQQLGKLWAGGGRALAGAGKSVQVTGAQRAEQLKGLASSQSKQIEHLVGQKYTPEAAARMVHDSTGHIAKMSPGQATRAGGVSELAGQAQAGLGKELAAAGAGQAGTTPSGVFNTMNQARAGTAPPPGFFGQHGNTLLTAGMMATMAPALIPMGGGGGGETPPPPDFGKMSAARGRTPKDPKSTVFSKVSSAIDQLAYKYAMRKVARVDSLTHVLKGKKTEKKACDIGLAGLESLTKSSTGREVTGRGFFTGETVKVAVSVVKKPLPTTVLYKRAPGGAEASFLSKSKVEAINAANAAKRKGPTPLPAPKANSNTGIAYDGMTHSESQAAAANRTRVVSNPAKSKDTKAKSTTTKSAPPASKPADTPDTGTPPPAKPVVDPPVAGTPPLAQLVPGGQIPVAHPVPLAQPVAPARIAYPPPPAPMPPRAKAPQADTATMPEHRRLSGRDLAGAAVGLSGAAGLAGLIGYHANRQGETSLGGPLSPQITSPTYAQPQFNTIGPTLSSPPYGLGVSSMNFPGMTRFASAGNRTGLNKQAFLDELKAHWQGLAPEHKVMTGLGGAAALGSLANGIRQGESGTGNTLLGLGGLAAGAYGLSGGKPLEAIQGIAGSLGKAFGGGHGPVPAESGAAGLASLSKDPKLSKYFDGSGNVNMMNVVKAPDEELRAGLAGVSPKQRAELATRISGFKPGLTHRIGARAMGVDIDGQKERLGKLLTS